MRPYVGAKVKLNREALLDYPDLKDVVFTVSRITWPNRREWLRGERRGSRIHCMSPTGGSPWVFFTNELKTLRERPVHMSMLPPQAATVLRHLQKRGSISPMEALISYGITRLAARIYDLRSRGYDITTDLRMDESGKGYARYSLSNAMKMAA